MSQQLEILQENPLQWSAISLVTPDIQKKEIKPFVILALKELEGVPDSRTSTLLCAERFAAVRGVVRHAARGRAAAGGWGREEVHAFLTGIRFTPECAEELATLLCNDRLYSNIPTHVRVRPGLARLHWKIDLSLSQSVLQSPQRGASDPKQIIHNNTHIILILTLTDGQTSCYRLQVAKFHQLRFSVASALKNLIVLERRKCMRD